VHCSIDMCTRSRSCLEPGYLNTHIRWAAHIGRSINRLLFFYRLDSKQNLTENNYFNRELQKEHPVVIVICNRDKKHKSQLNIENFVSYL
jgi:hypothetical protein